MLVGKVMFGRRWCDRVSWCKGGVVEVLGVCVCVCVCVGGGGD